MIKYPLSNEKAIRLMESENKLVFVVENKATKPQIKQACESLFSAKVSHINTQIDRDGRKRAIVTFMSETPAVDIATNLGLL